MSTSDKPHINVQKKESVENSTFASEPPTQPSNVERNKKRHVVTGAF